LKIYFNKLISALCCQVPTLFIWLFKFLQWNARSHSRVEFLRLALFTAFTFS